MVVEHAPIGIVVMDVDGVLVELNPEAQRILEPVGFDEPSVVDDSPKLGISQSQPQPQPQPQPQELARDALEAEAVPSIEPSRTKWLAPLGLRLESICSPDCEGEVRHRIQQASAGQAARFELELGGRARRLIRISLSAIKDGSGSVLRLMALLQDVTDARAQRERLYHEASTDYLTGLLNRRELEHRLSRVIESAANGDGEHILCYLDLDHFKRINDVAGHLAGDEMLREVAAVLKSGVRHRDTVARLGGDEFVLVMEHCSINTAARIAESIRRGISALRLSRDGQDFSVGVSIGIVALDTNLDVSHDDSFSQLLGRVDEACYAAKRAGGDRVVTWKPRLRPESGASSDADPRAS